MREVVFGTPSRTGLPGDDAHEWDFPFTLSDDDSGVKRRVTVREVGGRIDPFRYSEEEVVKLLFHFARLALQREAGESALKPHLSVVLNSVNTPRGAFPHPSQLPEPDGFRLELEDPPPRPLGFRP